MKEFIARLIANEGMSEVPFEYSNYNTYFVKGLFHTYYLFFFLEEEEQLSEIKEQSSELYWKIKKNKPYYEDDMDKNITCIYCLCVDDATYYQTESADTISELSKKICQVEEDLNYFKKNVLLYTKNMMKYAKEQVGKFDSICDEIITEDGFQVFRESIEKNYKYDFLVNLFIKLPFLNFQKYQTKNQNQYQSLKHLIQEQCEKKQIDMEEMERDMDKLEKIFDWYDQKMNAEANSNED